MIKYEDECFGCPPEIGCVGNACNACGYRNVKHLYCDKCGEDCEELYIDDYDNQVCEECLKKQFDKITLD